MSKVIGGILAMSLISSPSGNTIEFLAEQISKAQAAIISSIKNAMRQKDRVVSSDEIDNMLEELEKNSKSITTLMKYNYTAVGKIHTTMSLKAQRKQTMSNEQIEAYKNFNTTYEKQSKNLIEILDAIDNNDELNQVQKAILNDDDLTAYDNLKTVSNYQYEAIIELSRIFNNCKATLSYLQ